MKLINADEFLWKMEDYAITDADRDFCRKVKFALDKETPVETIPIEFLDTLAKNRPGMISATISLIKDKWGKEREKDGQVKSEHSGSSQGAENVAADRPPFDGIRPAPDRGLRTAEGLQPDGVFCIQKNAGRRKGTARDRIAEAVQKIDNLIETAEPIEEIDDINHSMIEMCETETGIEIQCGDGKNWKDLHYLNHKIDPGRMTPAKWIYMRRQQMKWMAPQIVAGILLALHRKCGFGFERCARMYQQIDAIEQEYGNDPKKAAQACLELTGVKIHDKLRRKEV